MANGPVLHRDDPDKEPLVGHIKVTREDWLNVARDILVTDGVAEVKVLAIGTRLEVSRSSFYWYFKSRKDLLSQLLDDWEARNTARIEDHCAAPAAPRFPCAAPSQCRSDPAGTLPRQSPHYRENRPRYRRTPHSPWGTENPAHPL